MIDSTIRQPLSPQNTMPEEDWINQLRHNNLTTLEEATTLQDQINQSVPTEDLSTQLQRMSRVSQYLKI